MLMIRIIQSNSIIQFEMLKDYSDEMEKLIKSKSSQHFERLKELSNKYNEDELDDFWYYNRERLSQFHIDYPNLLRASILTSAITELEITLVKIHTELRNNSQLKPVAIGNKQLKGSSIEKALQSICQTLPIRTHTSLSSWTKILFLIEIRNRVVHSAGQVHPVDHEELFNLLLSMEEIDDRTIRLSPYHELIFLEESSTFILKACNDILNSLIEEICEGNKELLV